MVAVDAIGSTFLSAAKKAIIINIKEIINVKLFPNTIGKVLSPDEVSPFRSGSVVIRATEEKDSAYGNNRYTIDISNGIKGDDWWFFNTIPQPNTNNRIPTIEFASHPSRGLDFQLNGALL